MLLSHQLEKKERKKEKKKKKKKKITFKMPFFATLTAAAAFLPALVSAHVMMVYPPSVYTHHDGTDLNPLNADGSNYPCFYTDGGTGDFPELALGSQQHIGLEGSAVHGGGSCQVSITYDVPPTKDSVFKVIMSKEGGCPISAPGNLPDDPTNTLPSLPYQVPSNIPAGKAVLAWTWFNKIGNREMYMRCAPVKLTGSCTETADYNKLPDMFKANIGNGCATTEGVDLTFPDPGSVVVGTGTGPPVGNCAAPVNPPVFVKPPTSSPAPAPTPVPSPSPTNEQQTPSSPPTPPTPTYGQASSTPTIESQDVKYGNPSPTPVPVSSPVPSPVSTTDESTGSTCTDGTIYCDSPTSFSMCDHGKLVSMGDVAKGTTCSNGHMIRKRDIRFSDAHIRRRRISIF